MPRNFYTDAQPSFPYESSVARAELGLPPSAEVHMAITELACCLMPLAQQANVADQVRQTCVLRVASGAVLFGWPLAQAQQELRVQLQLPLEPDVEVPMPWITNQRDWLAEAAAVLRQADTDVPAGFQRQRSNYGWRDLGTL